MQNVGSQNLKRTYVFDQTFGSLFCDAKPFGRCDMCVLDIIACEVIKCLADIFDLSWEKNSPFVTERNS